MFMIILACGRMLLIRNVHAEAATIPMILGIEYMMGIEKECYAFRENKADVLIQYQNQNTFLRNTVKCVKDVVSQKTERANDLDRQNAEACSADNLYCNGRAVCDSVGSDCLFKSHSGNRPFYAELIEAVNVGRNDEETIY